jgi:hypothetical protein
MIVEVEMVAFEPVGKDFGVREVEIPDEEACRASQDKLFELVFHYGQNDVQPKRTPSVSVGDVIRLDKRRFLVTMKGFHELGEGEGGGINKGYGFTICR